MNKYIANPDGTKEVDLTGEPKSKSLKESSQSSIWVEKTTRGYRWGVKLYFEGNPMEYGLKVMKIEDQLREKYSEPK
jgi:hypothetical protein